MKLFIAFDTGDKHIAADLVEILRAWFPSGLDVTFSPEFSCGTVWREKLGTAMRDHDALLALCSRRSLANRWIHFEAGAFFGRGKKVIPVIMGRLKPNELPEPLNTFQALNLEIEDDMSRLAEEFATTIGCSPSGVPRDAAKRIRVLSTTGVAETQEKVVSRLLDSVHLSPNRRALEVLAAAHYPYRLAIDDLILLFVSPNWEGLRRCDVVAAIEGSRKFSAEVTRVAREYQEQRPDRDDNKPKLALTQLDPFMTDRDHLRLVFERMRYFDFEGPRRKLFLGDSPTQFARDHYLAKEIPEGVPTPLACVHTVLLTRDATHLVLGLRRKAAKVDFYVNHLCIGFEEQMSPEDEDVWGTVKRGLRQEVGIHAVSDDAIELLAIGLEATFFSIAVIAVARLNVSPEELHRSIQTRAEDHEWDALFIPNDTLQLACILGQQLPRWTELGLSHFLQFTPFEEYEWHGTSRARLFAFLARQEGIGRLMSTGMP